MSTTTIDPAAETFFEVAVQLGLLDEAAVKRCVATARRTGDDPTRVALDRRLLTPAQVARVRQVAAARAPREETDADGATAWLVLVGCTGASFAVAAFAYFVATFATYGRSSHREPGGEADCLSALLITFLVGECVTFAWLSGSRWRLRRPDLPGWLIVVPGAVASAVATYAGMIVVVVIHCLPRIGLMCTSSGSGPDPDVTALANAVVGCLFCALFLPACYVACLPRTSVCLEAPHDGAQARTYTALSENAPRFQTGPTSAAPCAPGAAPAVRLCAPPGVRRSTRRGP